MLRGHHIAPGTGWVTVAIIAVEFVILLAALIASNFMEDRRGR